MCCYVLAESTVTHWQKKAAQDRISPLAGVNRQSAAGRCASEVTAKNDRATAAFETSARSFSAITGTSELWTFVQNAK